VLARIGVPAEGGRPGSKMTSDMFVVLPMQWLMFWADRLTSADYVGFGEC
jgi:hypothetical protein